MQFPPRLSWSSLVRVEFRNGTWVFFPSANAWITFLKKELNTSVAIRCQIAVWSIWTFMLFLRDCLTTTRIDQNWKTSYPNSSRDELMCCASLSLSPSAWVFLSRSLPAKSHLSINLSIKSSASWFSLPFWQLNWIITLLNKYSITLLNVLAFVSLFIEWILGCYLSTESSFVLSEPGRRLMKLRLLWQVKLIARFQYPLNRKVWKLFWLLQMEYEVCHAP